jgi:hypothetical protein
MGKTWLGSRKKGGEAHANDARDACWDLC